MNESSILTKRNELQEEAKKITTTPERKRYCLKYIEQLERDMNRLNIEEEPKENT